ncbi:MAG: putative integral membrane protein (TIGR00698 family) [Sulfurimonas sp.]|jgi:uncharacterized integral membrane protein (TIGR00698 family)
MNFSKHNRHNTLNGILFVALFAMASMYISDFSFFKHLSISPLIIGITLGIIYANTLRNKLPQEWVSGIHFCTKTLLRLAVAFYGFRITFQSITQIGISGIIVSVLIVILTFTIGYIVGTKILKLDTDTSILISAGSSICGAAAILATEPVLNSEPHKSAIAVSTVVVFGTIAMFLYPYLYQSAYLDLSPTAMGIYIGGTLHEVAHVVAAGNTLGVDISNNAVIVKMLRVMMIAPFLIVLGLWLVKSKNKTQKTTKITIPWFAIGFIAITGFNSLDLLPTNLVENINVLDTFALTMAMSALGMETSFKKFKGVGFKPIYLATILFFWLIFGGYYITKFSMNFI